MVKNIAIIPARSGSKRVLDKNIIELNDKPMIAYTIEAALNSGVFDEVIVSTDCEKYAEISRKYGASVPFLRDDCNDDYSSVEQVMLYVLNTLESKFGHTYDNFALLQPSCPLRNDDVIKNVYENFLQTDSPTLLTCFQFGFMNPWWAFKLQNGEADFILKGRIDSRSQDNEQLYCPSGAVGFAKVKNYKKEPTFYGNGHKFFPIDWKYAVDIDNYEDIEIAQAVMSMLENKFIKDLNQ